MVVGNARALLPTEPHHLDGRVKLLVLGKASAGVYLERPLALSGIPARALCYVVRME